MTTKVSKKLADLEFICNKSLWMSVQFAIFTLAIALAHLSTAKFIAYCAISILWYAIAICAAKKRKFIIKNNSHTK